MGERSFGCHMGDKVAPFRACSLKDSSSQGLRNPEDLHFRFF